MPIVANCSGTCAEPVSLSTTFTPATSCDYYWTPVTTLGFTQVGAQNQPILAFTRNQTVDACIPTELAAKRAECAEECIPRALTPAGCPDRWKVAKTEIQDETTTHVCCPSDAPVFTSETQFESTSWCQGTFAEGIMNLNYDLTSSFEVTVPLSSGSSVGITTSMITTIPSTSYNTYIYAAEARAGNLLVVLNASPTDTSQPPTDSPQPQPTASSEPTNTADGDGSQGLSTGAKAGIGIGVSLGIIALAAAVVALWQFRKRKASSTTAGVHSSGVWTKAELDNDQTGNQSSGHFKYAQPQEMPENDAPTELPEPVAPSELAAYDAPSEIHVQKGS